MIKINMNEYVYFKPKEIANQIYGEHFEKYGVPEDYIRELELDENGFTKMQFWDFVSVFGESITSMIMSEQPIQDFTIYFKENAA
jgi:hypothetical protein